MNSNFNGSRPGRPHYLMINGQRVYISDELQRMYNSYINSMRYRARREYSCSLPGFIGCRGDCWECPYHTEGAVLSLESPALESGAVPFTSVWSDPSLDPEETYIHKEGLQNILDTASSVAKCGDRLLYLSKVEGLSARKIGKILGIPHNTVNYRLAKILNYFMAHRSEFVDW